MLSWIKKYFTRSQSATNFWRMGSQSQGIHDPQKFFAVFACVSLIASDIGKMPLKIKRLSPSGVLVDTTEHGYITNCCLVPIRYKLAINSSRLGCLLCYYMATPMS